MAFSFYILSSLFIAGVRSSRSPAGRNGATYFNLGFGDIDENDRINDLSVSDNKDTKKVLATVATIVLESVTHFPDMFVYAKGNTPSRTRLYQIAVMSNWGEIEPLLVVFGFFEGKWRPFVNNVNYEAFICFLKRCNFIS